MTFWKRTLPTAIVMLLGLLLLVQYYIPAPQSQALLEVSNSWVRLISAFALVLGIASLLQTHGRKILRQQSGWGYSAVMYISLIATVVAGFWRGTEEGTPFMWIFNRVTSPLSSAMFSVLAFYITSAAYRAFRAKSTQAAIMLVAAIIVMLGRVPLGELISGHLPHQVPSLADTTGWIVNVPAMAARRGILLGISLSVLATSVRIILGLEKTYLGTEE